MKRQLKLSTLLNISFGLVLFVPMIIATVFSIVYYSNKIRQEAINTISSDLKFADIMYQSAVKEIRDLAKIYAQKKTLTLLLGLKMGEKIGQDLATSAKTDGLDLITVVDNHHMVLVRSHAPASIDDEYPQKDYIEQALKGAVTGGIELLSLSDIKSEGFHVDEKIFRDRAGFLTLTGVAPVYDRQQEHIVAVVILRRILSKDSELIHNICAHLKITVALFLKETLLDSCTGTPDGLYIAPQAGFLKKVLDSNRSMHLVDVSNGGSLSKFLPLQDFNGTPVAVLMVQRGVETYLQTRNTAIATLLVIFVTGMILATLVKTIIQRRILRPVSRLMEGTRKIGEGDYKYSLEVDTNDEIGDLTRAFNQMAKDLLEYDTQIRIYNLELEERVRERTAELEKTNKQLITANAVLEETLESLNPGVSGLIGKNMQKLGLVYATELVSDVCNYTKLNMILGETMMGEFMKKFFRESHKLLAEYRGMFDKTVGDQIVAIFGTPKDHYPASSTHPFDAIACAMKLIEASKKINAQMQEAIQDNYTAIVARHQSLSAEDRESIRIEDLKFQCRVGINTSNPSSDREIDRMRMVMMGAETCVDYTAQGGAIIYAFRLESTGTPGQIHIGENTKRIVEHVYKLEEMGAITLKGLGVQPRYRVIGKQSLFDNVYPKTRFYQKYHHQIPKILTDLVDQIRIGRMEIREVRKINKFVEVDIGYMEHLAGYYHLSLARALLAYAVAQWLEMDPDRLAPLVFAGLWHNATALDYACLEPLTVYPVYEQTPEDMDPQHVSDILDDLKRPKPELMESRVIAVCNYFDQKVFDRSFLKIHGKEVMSAKETISLMKLEERYAPELIEALYDLMVVEVTDSGQVESPESVSISLPDTPDILIHAIREKYTQEQTRDLLRKLSGEVNHDELST